MFMNNQAQRLVDTRGCYNSMGNSNKFLFQNSEIQYTITGNNNQFRFVNSRVRLYINGNNNQVVVQQSQIAYGINGNNNIVRVDQQSTSTCQYSNGNNQVLPFDEEQFRQRNQNNRQRNRRGSREPREQQAPQYQNHQENERNNWPRRQRNQNARSNRRVIFEQPNQRNRNNFSNQQVQQANFHPFQQFSQSIQQIFTQNLGRAFNFNLQIPQRQRQRHQGFQQPRRQNIFYFNSVPVEQQQLGLSQQELSLIPRSKHSGAPGKCTICLGQVENGEEETFLMCFHSFHWECIKDWLVKTAKCPLCQQDIKKHLRQQA